MHRAFIKVTELDSKLHMIFCRLLVIVILVVLEVEIVALQIGSFTQIHYNKTFYIKKQKKNKHHHVSFHTLSPIAM